MTNIPERRDRQPPQQIPAAEHQHPNAENTSKGGAETDGDESAAGSDSSWGTVEDDGGTELEEEPRRAAAIAHRADRPPGDRPVADDLARVLPTARPLVRTVGTRAGFLLSTPEKKKPRTIDDVV